MGLGKNKRTLVTRAAMQKCAMKKRGHQSYYVEIGERTLTNLGYWALENGLVLKEDEVFDAAGLIKDAATCPRVKQISKLVVKDSKAASWLRINHDGVEEARALIRGKKIVGIALWWNEDTTLIHPCIPSRNLDDVFIPSFVSPGTCFAVNAP